MRFDERPTCSVREAIEASGLGLTRIYDLIKTGKVESILAGGKRLIKVPSLLRLLESDFDPLRRAPPAARGADHYRARRRAENDEPEAA